MNHFGRHFLKFLGGFIAIILASLFLFFVVGFKG